MEKELTESEKQRIRDRIDRLKHLKEPFLKVVEIGIPVFITLLILLLGTATNYFDGMIEINHYNITLSENQTQNLSTSFYGNIEPIKTLNPTKIKMGFQNLLFAIIAVYMIAAFFMVFVSKYAKYDEQIKFLYNELVGIKNPKLDNISKMRQFFFSLKTKLFKFMKPKDDMERKQKKNTLEIFFKKNSNTLIVLSIFLLVTIGLVGKEGYLNNLLALLSALMTYFILIGLDSKKQYQKDTFSLWGFDIVFPIFISTFCAWVILNVVITLTGEVEKFVWGLVWLAFMLIPSIKFWFKKN